jgi:hypothetical protein
MGSYHTTCNISQLPITPGDRVRVLFLGKSPYSMDPRNEQAIGEGNNSREGCYSTDFWYPRTVPLKAKYDDYGRVREVEEGLKQDLFWDQLRDDLYTVEVGENPFHDPASSSGMDWDQMWWVAVEGRLRTKRVYPDEHNHVAVPVCAVMIREDVWQAMLALKNPWEGHEYVNGKYEYSPLTLDFYKSRMLKAINNILEKPMSDWDKEYALKTGSSRFRYAMELERLFLDHNNPPGSNGYQFYLQRLIEKIEAGELTLDSPEAQELIHSIAEMQHVKGMFSVLRKTWHPGTGQGSQGAEYETEAQFHHAMALIGYRAMEIVNKDRARWDVKEDEDGNEIIPTVNRLDPDAFLSSLILPSE